MTEERNHRATPERRREARRQGRAVVSYALASALALLAFLLVLEAALPRLLDAMRELLARGLRGALAPAALDPRAAAREVREGALALAGPLAPLALVGLAVAAGACLLQSAMLVRPGLVAPRWSRLSPAAGWARLLSLRSLWTGALTVLEAALVAGAFAWAAWPLVAGLPELLAVPAAAGASQVGRRVASAALVAAAGFVLLGAIDWAFQRWRFAVELRMSRQEILEEQHSQEGDPRLKRALGRFGRRLLQGRREGTPLVSASRRGESGFEGGGGRRSR